MTISETESPVTLWGALVDLVLPRACVDCSAPDGPLCAACRPSLRVRRVPRTLDPVVFAAVGYDGAVRTLLLHYKERRRRDLAPELARLLAGAIEQALRESDPAGLRPVLVAAPSTRAAAAARGGDHMARLARRAGRATGIAVARGVLRLDDAARDSAGLGARERAENLHGAMSAAPPRPGFGALLVDDVVTTGTTVREACRALTAAGWSVRAAAVVAEVDAARRTSDPAGVARR